LSSFLLGLDKGEQKAVRTAKVWTANIHYHPMQNFTMGEEYPTGDVLSNSFTDRGGQDAGKSLGAAPPNSVSSSPNPAEAT
jgi:hypothetical protein